MPYTAHQIKYFAEQLMLKRPQCSIDGLASAMSGVKVDLNPHQVDAALFALQSPLSNGALLADEVGLGKTIEAGLVLAQCWSERKRKILLIVTASLRTQWRTELDEKFFIRSEILESKNYNKAKKENPSCNPFLAQDAVVICSYNFASAKIHDISSIDWDLVIMDEAHKLRNVYKRNNVMGNNLKTALHKRKKLLLTATPLQNNLMELYGLVSIIDEQVFGDPEVFREVYVNVTNIESRNRNLKGRLHNFCKRTLRRQVAEYVPYTNRTTITEEYTPSHDEEQLYTDVSNYLQRERLHAFPQGQRQLLMLVARKLLASSSMAIHGTLSTIIDRLNLKLSDYKTQLNLTDLDDYDGIEELIDEEANGDDDGAVNEMTADYEGIKAEIRELQQFAALAERITTNAKGDNLLTALNRGFEMNERLGGARKAVIFTESKRTQQYLMRLLSQNGYEGQIVFLDGSNNDPVSTRVFKEWRERHKDDGKISGSTAADKKSAIVEEFRDRASILIGTEAAAEGINLQFCNIVVNYDLPWNPQRIEQRILASYAQEESRSVSENCKWRIRKDYKEGNPSNNIRIYGYEYKAGKLTVIPEEAEVVRMIFADYLSGLGKNAIMKKLIRLGIPTKCGGRWARNTVNSILTNEKFIGDMCLQKGFVIDHITKNRKHNKGELAKYYVEDNHEAIIDKETFEAVKAEKARRAEKSSHPRKPIFSEFSGLITCGRCGAKFRKKVSAIGTKYAKPKWGCTTYTYQGKHECAAKRIPEDILKEKCAEALGLAKYNPAVFTIKVDSITIPDDGVLVFKFKDGTDKTIHWENRSRRESWTEEMKQAAREKALEGCGKNG